MSQEEYECSYCDHITGHLKDTVSAAQGATFKGCLGAVNEEGVHLPLLQLRITTSYHNLEPKLSFVYNNCSLPASFICSPHVLLMCHASI